MKRKGYSLEHVVHVVVCHLLREQSDKDDEYEQLINDSIFSESPGEMDELVQSVLKPDIRESRRRKEAYKRFCQYTGQRNRFVFTYWRQMAAIVILLLLVGGGVWWISGIADKTVVVSQSIVPAQPKALLVLSDGSQIDLSTLAGSKKIHTDNITACDSGILEYHYLAGEDQQSLTYNQVYVPRGGEYQLILSDGTRIWMNADSKLKYPVRFGKGERDVYIRGEAYFEVAEDAGRPFRVHTSKGIVEVLGTRFNVRDYEDEEEIVTTLAQGKVEYRSGDRRVILEPGFQAVDVDGCVSVHQVNLEEYVGWKDGKYIFFDKDLESLMHYIERTYDVAVFFAHEEVKHLRFSGDLQRYDRVELFLRYLETGGDLRFEVKNKTISVYKK